MNILKSALHNLVVFFGLGLVIDNWGRNHVLLLAPGIAIFLFGLRAVIKEEVRATINGKE